LNHTRTSQRQPGTPRLADPSPAALHGTTAPQ